MVSSNSSQNDNLDDRKTQDLEIQKFLFGDLAFLANNGFQNVSISRSNRGLVSPYYLLNDKEE